MDDTIVVSLPDIFFNLRVWLPTKVASYLDNLSKLLSFGKYGLKRGYAEKKIVFKI